MATEERPRQEVGSYVASSRLDVSGIDPFAQTGRQMAFACDPALDQVSVGQQQFELGFSWSEPVEAMSTIVKRVYQLFSAPYRILLSATFTLRIWLLCGEEVVERQTVLGCVGELRTAMCWVPLPMTAWSHVVCRS